MATKVNLTDRAAIVAATESVSDLRLAPTPSPLHAIPNFRAALQEDCDHAVPDIYIKRDDMTGFGFGGNKARHMGISFARFVEDEIETVVNINHYHSNQARFIAAACAKVGIRCHLIAFDMVDALLNGNLLLAKMFGAEIHRVPEEYARQVAERVLDEERDAGRRSVLYGEHQLASVAGMLAFFKAGPEWEWQLCELGIGNGPVQIWGLTGRSIAGLKLFANATGMDWRTSAVRYTPIASGVSCCDADGSFDQHTVEGSQAVAEILNLDTAIEPGEVRVVNGYAGPAYGVPDGGVFEAMHLLAKTEGIILDPNYTGKSMSGLIGELRSGRVDPCVPIVFLHSGGLPQVFAHADAIWSWGPDR